MSQTIWLNKNKSWIIEHLKNLIEDLTDEHYTYREFIDRIKFRMDMWDSTMKLDLEYDKKHYVYTEEFQQAPRLCLRVEEWTNVKPLSPCGLFQLLTETKCLDCKCQELDFREDGLYARRLVEQDKECKLILRDDI